MTAIRAALAAAALAIAAPALAHWFIPASCCGRGDCEDIPPRDVRDLEESDEYELTTPRFGVHRVKRGEAKASPDGWFYLCFDKSVSPPVPRQGCAWAPRGSV